MATPRGTAIHTQITGGTYSAPPTANHKVALSAMVARGVLTPSGAYAPGKGQADLERAIGAPDPVTEMLNDIAKVIYMV